MKIIEYLFEGLCMYRKKGFRFNAAVINILNEMVENIYFVYV